MKRRIIGILSAMMIATIMLSGCGNSSDSVRIRENRSSSVMGSAELGKPMAAETFSDDYDYESYADYDSFEDANGITSIDVSIEDSKGKNLQNAAGIQEMLVYRCTMEIDTLDFDKAIKDLKRITSDYGGFVSDEYYYDTTENGSSYYRVEDDDKQCFYRATIRVPSAKYNDFVSATEGVGDLRKKDADVQDLSMKYGTLASELAILEADYDRLFEQYENTTDEGILLYISSELRDLAIQIADIKTSMSTIESDVEYSYVTVNIKQVRENVEPTPTPTPVPKTFKDKLKAEGSKSWSKLVDFFQSIVLFIVRTWWKWVLVAGFVVLNIVIIRLIIKRKRARNQREIEEMKRIAEERTKNRTT